MKVSLLIITFHVKIFNRVFSKIVRICFFFLATHLFAQTRSFTVPSDQAGTSYLQALVSTNGTPVYSSPQSNSAIVGKLNSGDVVSSSVSVQGWCQVKLLLQSRRVLTGWVAASTLSLVQPTQIAQVAPAPPRQTVVPRIFRPPYKKSIRSSERHSISSLSLAWTPVYDLHKFGESQQGLVVEYQRSMTPLLSWGLPLSYAVGKNFNNISGGVCLNVNLYHGPVTRLYVKPDLSAEYFYSGSQNMKAFSMGLSFGARFQWSKSFGIGLEPYSIFSMMWNNQEIPWNLRARSALYTYFSF